MNQRKGVEFGSTNTRFHEFSRGSGFPTLELDPTTLKRRQKQITYGKVTKEYKNYVECVPIEKRGYSHPKTPDITRRYSRRAWDGLIKKWRLTLHRWTFPEPTTLNPVQDSLSAMNNNNYSIPSTSSCGITGCTFATSDTNPPISDFWQQVNQLTGDVNSQYHQLTPSERLYNFDFAVSNDHKYQLW